MPSQQERKSDTRDRLLAAAASVFAARGFEGASVDLIATGAGRTSGAIYAHFGSKEGLLVTLLESWRGQVVASIDADLRAATDLDERLAVLWRNFADPRGDARQWVQLEHELWRWATATGHRDALDRLRQRYRDVWRGFGELLRQWPELDVPRADAERVASAVIGLLIGLEMEHRLAPDVVDERVAVETMRAVLHRRRAVSGGRAPRTGSTR